MLTLFFFDVVWGYFALLLFRKGLCDCICQLLLNMNTFLALCLVAFEVLRIFAML